MHSIFPLDSFTWAQGDKAGGPKQLLSARGRNRGIQAPTFSPREMTDVLVSSMLMLLLLLLLLLLLTTWSNSITS